MRLLLDTHLIIWWEADSPRLPRALPQLITQADTVFVSRVSLWEMAIKLSSGKLRLDLEMFANNIVSHGFEWLNITNRHLFEVAALRTFSDHKDPFARLLVAQSLSESLCLVTADRHLERYGETVSVL